MNLILDHLVRRPVLDGVAQLAHRPGLSQHIDHRTVRVAVLLIVVVLLNFSDLAYTLFANSIGMLQEQNPIAESFLGLNQDHVLICYKLLMLLIGTFILWKLRRNTWTILGCWLLIAVYAGLGVIWWMWSRQVNEIFELSGPLNMHAMHL